LQAFFVVPAERAHVEIIAKWAMLRLPPPESPMREVTDPHNLQRFVDAQNPIFAQVCAELRRGRKTGHWMWFVFPQLRGLGFSAMANRYAIASRVEAAAYLEHPVLGPRLRRCARLVTEVEGRAIGEIFGYPDDLKFRSSMTLFAHASPDNAVFTDALRKYFTGAFDRATLDLLQEADRQGLRSSRCRS
jgi:uncharacterized protein (DUF1810 family)